MTKIYAVRQVDWDDYPVGSFSLFLDKAKAEKEARRLNGGSEASELVGHTRYIVDEQMVK